LVLLLLLFHITNKSRHKQRLKSADDNSCNKINCHDTALQLDYRNIVFQLKANMEDYHIPKNATVIGRGVKGLVHKNVMYCDTHIFDYRKIIF